MYKHLIVLNERKRKTSIDYYINVGHFLQGGVFLLDIHFNGWPFMLKLKT
jgi:hypothetical protein